MRVPAVKQVSYYEQGEMVEVHPGCWMPSQFGATFEFHDFPTIAFDGEAHQGEAPGFTCISVSVPEDGDGRGRVTVNDLRRVDIRELLARAIRDIAQTNIDGYDDGPDAQVDAETASELSRRKRRAITPQLLTRVATLYENSGGGERAAEAIQADLHYSKSQAYRLIQRARAAGYLREKGAR